jgi:hypothetical protein
MRKLATIILFVAAETTGVILRPMYPMPPYSRMPTIILVQILPQQQQLPIITPWILSTLQRMKNGIPY